MSLIKSISGIRGTIGGVEGENLSLLDIVKFSAAYAGFIKKNNPNLKSKVVLGRDGRISGKMVKDLVVGTLLSQGLDVVDLDLASTPTIEMMVIKEKAQGGIIISASHNPQGWNALKFLDHQGEFLTADQGNFILKLAEESKIESVSEDKLGNYSSIHHPFQDHLKAILSLSLVKKDLIAKHNFKVVIDGINSVGGIILPQLLEALGVNNIVKLNCLPNGKFSHQPEPLDKNLSDLKELVVAEQADLGIVVDPDVDRLAFVDEKGKMFGEEYTLVAVADYVLKNYNKASSYKKRAVSNLSSSRALADIAKKYSGEYYASAVGELNVVKKMKEVSAVIGGEGNGGVIYPELHYGRDALVGLALFLSYLAISNKKMSELKKDLPTYFMVKDRLDLDSSLNLKELFKKLRKTYSSQKIIDIDGLKIEWPDSWIHLRASNTEAILRIYAEAPNLDLAQDRVADMKRKIMNLNK